MTTRIKNTATTRAKKRGRPRKMSEVLPPAMEKLASELERDAQRMLDAAAILRGQKK